MTSRVSGLHMHNCTSCMICMLRLHSLTYFWHIHQQRRDLAKFRWETYSMEYSCFYSGAMPGQDPSFHLSVDEFCWLSDFFFRVSFKVTNSKGRTLVILIPSACLWSLVLSRILFIQILSPTWANAEQCDEHQQEHSYNNIFLAMEYFSVQHELP